MELEVKRPDHIVPSYSLTGDLLSYLRCRLQYRYHNRSSLPPSRPVQLWFGEFIHGTLELCFRYWQELDQAELPIPDFPWPCSQRQWRQDPPVWQPHDIGRFANTIETFLLQQGKQARSSNARDSAYRRVEAAVNQLGPHLFPLIAFAEKKVIGSRPVPESPLPLRCNNYEVHGVIDVLTHFSLEHAPTENIIREAVRLACPDLVGSYEVIVDYKGSRRPLIDQDYWRQGEWQINTYAWLRGRQSDAQPIAAGILIYINELSPGNNEISSLKRGIANGTTDILPVPGSVDEQLVRMWRPGSSADQLSLQFRLQRAIRVIPVSATTIAESLESFDNVVRSAEEDIVNESQSGDILNAWSPDCQDSETCDACDFRYFCPSPSGAGDAYQVSSPPPAARHAQL